MNRFGIPLSIAEVVVGGEGEHFVQFMLVSPNTDLSSYRYGKERVIYDKDGILKLTGRDGSIRYLYRDSIVERFIGALQLVRQPYGVEVSTIFTEKEYRQNGIATSLIRRAMRDYGRRLRLSPIFTKQGAEFFQVG